MLMNGASKIEKLKNFLTSEKMNRMDLYMAIILMIIAIYSLISLQTGWYVPDLFKGWYWLALASILSYVSYKIHITKRFEEYLKNKLMNRG